MRCDAMRREVQVQGRSRQCQGVYFYKHVGWTGLDALAARMLKSQCRSVVGHLAVKIRFSLAGKRGGCLMGDAGPWM